MDKKTKFWIGLFSALLVVSCAAFLWLRESRPAGLIALVYLDGQLVKAIDLAAVDTPYEFTAVSGRGENTLSVRPGSIAVVSADCPDKLCVRQGAVETGGIPIICLPHRLVITLSNR